MMGAERERWGGSGRGRAWRPDMYLMDGRAHRDSRRGNYILSENVIVSAVVRIGNLRNLGPVSERMLNAVGVHTAAELRDLGAVNAYRLLALRGHRPSLNLVWAIEGALTDVHWMDLSAETKARLKAELEAPWDARGLLEDGDAEDGGEG